MLRREDWAIEAIQAPEQKWIVPIPVHTGFAEFTLIAVWACRVGNTKLSHYIGQVCQAEADHTATCAVSFAGVGTAKESATAPHAWICKGPKRMGKLGRFERSVLGVGFEFGEGNALLDGQLIMERNQIRFLSLVVYPHD